MIGHKMLHWLKYLQWGFVVCFFKFLTGFFLFVQSNKNTIRKCVYHRAVLVLNPVCMCTLYILSQRLERERDWRSRGGGCSTGKLEGLTGGLPARSCLNKGVMKEKGTELPLAKTPDKTPTPLTEGSLEVFPAP